MEIVVLIILAVAIIGGLIWFFMSNKPKPQPEPKPKPGQSSGDTPMPEPSGNDSPTEDNTPDPPCICESETHRIDGTVNFFASRERVQVGWYDDGYMCDCKWSIKGVEYGVNFLRDIKFEDGKITAIVSNTNYGEERVTHYVTHLEGTNVSKDDWFEVTQASGAELKCEIPTAQESLDVLYIPLFSGTIGFEITPINAPCTYTYLSNVYTYVCEDNDPILISWTLANAMAEITPYKDLVTNYFINAAKRYGGIGNLNENEYVYNQRIAGGLKYAEYKHKYYSESNEMADNARKELHDKGIGTGELINVDEFSYDNPIYVKLDRIIPSTPPVNEKDNVDFNITQKEVINNPQGTKQAIADKNSSDEYLCENVFGLDYNSAYSDLLEYGGGFTSAANGFVKWNDDYARWRPGAYQKIEEQDSKFIIPEGGRIYIATERTTPSYRSEEVDDMSYTSACGACGGCNGECDRCNDDDCIGGYPCNDDCTRAKELGINDRCPEDGMNSYQSFPSGHSCKAYFQYLMCVESAGISDKNDRVLDYCYNRVVVRAHWYSDIIAGKYNAASQIGFMNGVKQFHDKLPK